MTKSKPAVRRPPQLDEENLQPAEELDPDLDVYRVRLTGDHAGRHGAGEFTEVVADGASLAATRFDPLALTDVALRRADLSNAVWEGLTARRVEVDGCRTVGWRVIAEFAEDLLVQGCRWEHGALYLGRTRGLVVFKDCSFAGTTLRGDFSRVVLDGCDLAGAEFGASAATGCDLRTSRLSGVRGLSTLRGARITPVQAVELADLLATEAGFDLT